MTSRADDGMTRKEKTSTAKVKEVKKVATAGLHDGTGSARCSALGIAEASASSMALSRTSPSRPIHI